MTPEGDEVVATAFANPPAPFPTVTPQIDLYAVSHCLRDS